MKADSYKKLTPVELERLHEIVFDREFNELHEDDYFNAGGFFAHWSTYTDEEREHLMRMAKQEVR